MATRVQLATLEGVQNELNMNEEQKELANKLNQELGESLREMFQERDRDFRSMSEEIEKQNNQATEKLYAKLDEQQQKRLTGIYAQVNGPNVLFDDKVQEQLGLSEEQVEKLTDVQEENRQSFRDAFRDFREMSDEERRESFGKLRSEGEANLLAALDEEQRKAFEELKGQELELDLSELRPRRRGGRGNQ